MKTTTKIAIGVGVILLAVGSGALVLPMVMSGLESRGSASLERRGIELKYDASNWRGDSGDLSNVSVHWSAKGITCSFENLSIDVGILSSLTGSPHIDHVGLTNGDCEIDRNKLIETKTAKTTDALDDESGGMLRSILASPPTIDIRKLLLRTDGVSVNLDSVTINNGGDIEFLGTVKALEHSVDFKGEGSLDSDDGVATASIRNPSNETLPLVEFVKDSSTKLSVGTASMSVSYRERTGTATLGNVNANYETSSVALKKIRLVREPRSTVTIEGGDVLLSLSDLKSLRGLVSHAKTSPNSGTKSVPSKKTSGLTAQLRSRLSDMELRWENVHVHVGRADRKITVFEQLAGEFADDKLDVIGVAADGTFHAAAQFDRTQLVPLVAEAQLRNVELSAIPGLDSARSQLPNRGTSGAIGGKLNGAISWRRSMSVATPSEFAFAGFWDQGELDLDGVSEEPIKDVSVRWVGSASIDQNLRSIQLRSVLSSRGVKLTLNGEADDWPTDPKISVTASAETLDCQTLANGLPPGLLGGYRNTKFGGKATPKITFELPFNRPGELTLDVKGYEKCEVNSLNALPSVRPKVRLSGSEKTVSPSDVMWLKKPFIIPVLEGIKDNADISVGPGTKMYLSLGALPKHAGAAAFLSEQTGFYDGHAINFGLVQRALRRNLEEGRFVYGGSTVTQQLVKNLFLTRDKTIARKIQEMIVAWRIDQVISKDRILELYINCIEYGPNIYGIGTASRYYFQKSAVTLKPKESIFLAMLKPAPWQGPGFMRRGEAPTYTWWVERIEVLFQRLVDFKYLTEEEALTDRLWQLKWNSGNYTPYKSEPLPEPENQVQEENVE